MKRNFADSSLMRSTAGCLPVPLFNQKKRTKQPLTSNPLKNEPSSNNSADHFNFSALLADFGWETEKPEPIQLQKTVGTNPTELASPSALSKQQHTSKPTMPHAGSNLNNRRQEESTNVWKRNDFPAFGHRTENKKLSELDVHPSHWMKPGAMYQKPAGLPQASQRSRREEAEDWDPAVSQWPAVPTARLRNLPTQEPSYTFKHSPGPQNTHKEKADHLQSNKTIQKRPVGQSKAKEKENSLRILSAVIESMKHWSQYSNKTPLLFEVLGVLDSAVTPGQFRSKTFLLRDGKETVTCIFYEIDRELPRLIRGRVHRCMGNYDAKHKMFKCVSVRPATAAEQQTFQGFVKAADVEMCRFVKTSNEI
ncbi:spermatogenesis-associated protein 22 isoform X3 [Pantherophis guttatus]|nr:spermatogenesis-associated protein 22 isoform X3 [Pantherophis guttatus]XP_034261244.2 spermatogenesis-associated protein 22 isoform X3 [Pantherophis guttatus]XP_034261245.2 spermatogenesis-associated protein 22 isoform X3 [Pantherophis guttatus]